MTANTAPGGGAGILNDGQLTVTDSLIQANGLPTQGAGGGIYNVFASSKTTLVRTVVERNSAVDGGGIQNFRGTVNLSGGTGCPA